MKENQFLLQENITIISLRKMEVSQTLHLQHVSGGLLITLILNKYMLIEVLHLQNGSDFLKVFCII